MTTAQQLFLSLVLLSYLGLVWSLTRDSQRSRHAARARKRLRQSLLDRRD